MAETSTEINEKEFAKLTTVKVPHKFGDLEITHTYLVEDDETYVKLDKYQQALEGKDIDYYSRHYFELEKELGLVYQDTVDENCKIVAAVITKKVNGNSTYDHYKKGVSYNFLKTASKYTIDETNKIIWALGKGRDSILSDVQLAAFDARYFFYKNKDLSVQAAKSNLDISDFSNEGFDQAVKIANACRPDQ